MPDLNKKLNESLEEWSDIVRKAADDELPRDLTEDEVAVVKRVYENFFHPNVARERWPVDRIEKLSVRQVPNGGICVHAQIRGNPSDQWTALGKGNLRVRKRGFAIWFRHQSREAIQDFVDQWEKAHPVPQAVKDLDAQEEKERQERRAARLAEAAQAGKAQKGGNDNAQKDEKARVLKKSGPTIAHVPALDTVFAEFYDKALGSPLQLLPEHVDQWVAHYKATYEADDGPGKLEWVTSEEYKKRLRELRVAREEQAAAETRARRLRNAVAGANRGRRGAGGNGTGEAAAGEGKEEGGEGPSDTTPSANGGGRGRGRRGGRGRGPRRRNQKSSAAEAQPAN